VSITERITPKAFTPSVEQNSPETFCLTLKVLTALSEALLSGSIFQSYKNENGNDKSGNNHHKIRQKSPDEMILG
jgi:hypothetical protein